MAAPKEIPDSDRESKDAWLETASGGRIQIGPGCSIGRGAENRVVIPTDRASRRHALVQARTGSEYWLTDLGSINGTLLNNRRIARAARLRDGDEVVVAGVSFRFRCASGSETETQLTGEEATSCDVREQRSWLLVADLEDSTGWSREVPPAELGVSVQRWLSGCRAVVERHAGHVNRYLGDSLLAFWPDTAPSVASVAAALGELHTLRASARPAFRVVAHLGAIVFAGSVSTGEENLLGADVTFIFRLEKIAARLREPFVVSAAAAPALRAHLALDSLGSHTVKDYAGRHECFRARPL